MLHRLARFELNAGSIALAYVVFGGAWITLSDRALETTITDPDLYGQIQTVKGWLFVALSGLLIYWLVARRQRELERANEDLETAVQQASILHRVLRHNLRNLCNVIKGYTDLLERADQPDEEECLQAIRTHTDELVEISEKSRHLRGVVFEEGSARRPIDVVEIVDTRVERMRESRPAATIETDLPSEGWAFASERLGVAIDELIENAIEHADSEHPTVTVTARTESAWVTIEVRDRGPGLPETERNVLEREVEQPLQHSTGIGLWIVRTIVEEFDGSLEIDEASGETLVRVRLHPATGPEKAVPAFA